MARKAAVKYRSLRSNLVHLPLSLYASLAQSQTKPQSIIIHLSPLVPGSNSTSPPQSAFLGWSGFTSVSSLSDLAGDSVETLEIDPEVALSYSWAEGTILDISIIYSPVKARSVSITPLTSDDWEILEQNANYLENNLLSQLRATNEGQEIHVWVMGRTKIRVRVDATSPPTSFSTAVLICPETEIIVAPRIRPSVTSPDSYLSKHPAITKADVSFRKKPGTKDISLRLVPQAVARHWGIPELSIEEEHLVGHDRVAWCAPITAAKVQHRMGSSSDSNTQRMIINVRMCQTGRDVKPISESLINAQDSVKEEICSDMWLLEWKTIPPGCIVLSEPIDVPGTGWARVSISSPKGKNFDSAPSDRLPEPSLTPSHSTLVGVETFVEEAVRYFARGSISKKRKPLLLSGPKGTGKTAIAKAIGRRLEADRNILAENIYIDIGRLDLDSPFASIKDSVSTWERNTKSHRPCLLVLDNLDLLLGPEKELATSSSDPAVLVEHFLKMLYSVSGSRGIMILVTASATASIHPLLTAKHAFGKTIKLSSPSQDMRGRILQAIVTSQAGKQNFSQCKPPLYHDSDLLDYVTLATLTEGYSVSDLADLVVGATRHALSRMAVVEDEQLELAMDDFSAAKTAFTPYGLRRAALQTSEVRWEEIGGLHEPRKILRETLEWPTKYAQIFAHCPLRLRSGILLYGFPGCGKTLLASAVARECGLNFINVKGPEILNKYIGASEQSVRELFERASAAKPCVLFFDEFDSIAPKRGHDSTGVTDRVVNQMLTEMDGAQGLDGVYILAATSRPDLIDPALLRPGRLDKAVLCDMPTALDRYEIIHSLSARLDVDPSIDLQRLAEETEGYSGADLQGLIYNAHLEAVNSVIGLRGDASFQVGDESKKTSLPNSNGLNHSPHKSFRQVQPIEVISSSAARASLLSRLDKVSSAVPLGNGNERDDDEREHFKRPAIQEHHLHISLLNSRPSVPEMEYNRLSRIYSTFISGRDGTVSDGDLGRDTGTRMSLM